MCRFHKELAIDIATDPVTKKVDPVAYSITLVALAKYWIDRYMPEMSDCDGNSAYAMATPKAVASLDKSGLSQDVVAITEFRAQNIGTVRNELAALIREQGLTLGNLHLPKNPVKDERFLNDSMMALFEGDPQVELTLKKSVDVSYEPMRKAIEGFTSRGDMQETLRKLIEGNFARLFIEARSQVNPTLLKAYNKLPERLVGAFKTCATCVGGGAGGAAVSHIGCVAIPLVAGAGGTALSATMNAFMLVTSPLIALGVTAGYAKLRGQPQSLPKLAGSAAIALAVAFGVNAMNGHANHGGDHEGHEGHSHHATMTNAEIDAMLRNAPTCIELSDGKAVIAGLTKETLQYNTSLKSPGKSQEIRP